MAERLDSRTRLIGRPGELMSYSNDSYGLISDIVRRYEGEPSFSHYVVRHILEPLEMRRSTLEFESPVTTATAPGSTSTGTASRARARTPGTISTTTPSC